MPGGDGSWSATQERLGQGLRAGPAGYAGEAVDVVAERTGTPPPSSPVKLSGSIPPLAESFHQRPETGLDLRAGLYPGDTVVLTHAEDTPAAPAWQGGTGKTQLAVAFAHALVTATEAASGRDHPDAIAARAGLASAYRRGGKPKDAIVLSLRVLADRERVQGPDHADTRAARAHLAAAYQQSGRLGDAIHHYEQALADSERMLGPAAAETLSARSSLAGAHIADGRPAVAVPLLQRAVADGERYLGPDHPLTRAVRDQLETVTRG